MPRPTPSQRRSPTTSRLRLAVLVAAAASVTVLAVAPAAHAGWVTGSSTPPVISTDPACQNGISWRYATYFTGTAWPPQAPQVTLHDLAVVSPAEFDVQDPPDPSTVLAGGTYAVPRKDLYIDPLTIAAIPSALYVPGRVGWFDYSGEYLFTFNRTLAPGTHIRVQWRSAPGVPYTYSTAWRYTVANCWTFAVGFQHDMAGGLEAVVASTPGFDVTTLNPQSIRLAQSPTRKLAPIGSRVEDNDGDGDQDLVLLFQNSGSCATGRLTVTPTARGYGQPLIEQAC